jgi:putative Mg2+ transporter-C (MgtC) family protein
MDQEIIFQLLASVILGAIIGMERETKRKGAGLQTYSLICFGSCLFSTVAFYLGNLKILDPSIIIMAVAVGMGFIGAGVISKKEEEVFGLTTAAGLWATSAMGLALGAKLYSLALLSTIFILLIFVVFGFVEKTLFKK